VRLPLASVLFLAAMGSAAFGARIVVSPSGNDASGDGTEAAPFATLERARDAARSALKAGEPVEVILHGGTYELKSPLVLGLEDSGTSSAPAIWQAAPGEEVRISGGRWVTDWKPVSDPAIKARLDPAVRDRVLQAGMKAAGVTDYGEMSGGFAKQGSTGIELFVDDAPMQIARYPNRGFIKIADVMGPTPVNDRGHKGTKEGIFRVEDSRVARWAQESDPRAMGYWCWDWADERQKIASIDPRKLVVTLAPPWHSFGYSAGQYFYGFNLLCEIDEPGEWYLDHASGLLYLLPPGGVAPKRAMVTVIPSIVQMEKAAHIEMRGLILEGARGKAVTMTDCDGCRVEGCTVRNSGSWGVWVSGGRDCAVERCAIYGTGDGGVWLQGGDRATLTPANHLVENCDIHDYARWDRTYQPGVHLEGVGCRVAHNAIHDAPHQAISFDGNDHVIEFNDIRDVCRESNDAGAIYAWNDWAGRGHRISNNYLHDINGYESKGANGIYLDDDYSSAEISGNVFRHVACAIFLGGGRDHVVNGNLVAQCGAALHIDARGLDWRAFGFNELKQKLEKWPYQKPPWSERYPTLVNMLKEEPMAPRGIVVEHNIFAAGQVVDIFPKARPYVALKQNVFDAPASAVNYSAQGMPEVDPANPLFRGIDFKQIPYGQIGIVAKKDGERP